MSSGFGSSLMGTRSALHRHSGNLPALHVTDWGPYAYDMFKFGFENYSGTPRTLWYDDVAIASQQIGCFP